LIVPKKKILHKKRNIIHLLSHKNNKKAIQSLWINHKKLRIKKQKKVWRKLNWNWKKRQRELKMNYYLKSRVIRTKIFKLLTMIRWKWKIQKFKSFQSLIQLNLQDILSIVSQGLMMKGNLNSKEDTENLQLLAKSLKLDGRDAMFQLSPRKSY
jgi:hypothetical protein